MKDSNNLSDGFGIHVAQKLMEMDNEYRRGVRELSDQWAQNSLPSPIEQTLYEKFDDSLVKTLQRHKDLGFIPKEA